MITIRNFIITLSSLIVLLFPLEVFGDSKDSNLKPVLIESFEKDITGDGTNEVIELKGILFSKGSNYYRDIWVDITSKFSEKWRITYEGGYEPKLQFVDLNHDHVNDLFYQSATGGSGGLYNYHLHTLKGSKIQTIPLPKQNYVKGKFENNFKITIHISPASEPIEIDVKNRANEYIRLGIYNEQGKLLKPTPVMVDPIAFFEPVLISKNAGYGLKSYQQISGAYHADQLGTVETLWYYDKDKWIILNSNWVSTK